LSEVSDFFARYLWRFYPVAFLSWALGGLMHWALSILESEEERQCMLESRAYCAWYGGWLMLIEHRLNALITFKAMRNLRRPCRAGADIPRVRAWGVTSLGDAYARFMRLARRYHDLDRLVRARTLKLQRMFEKIELQLEVVHRPVEVQPVAASPASIPTPAAILPIDLRPAAPISDTRIRAPP
jgi:hypothetical protein